MIDPILLLTFIPACLALNLTPGADMMFCLGQGLRSGPRAAMAANFGIGLGCMVHTLLAGLGLGAVVQAHPLAFDAIRWLGVGYLLWLAVQAMRNPLDLQTREVAARPLVRVFRDALIVNLLNPKVILFILAFLPQFVDPTRAVLPQFLTLGAILAAGGLVINGLVGGFAGGIGRKLAGSVTLACWLPRVSAAIFAGLATRLAMMQRG
ncbi:MAG: LysE family translocator [Rhodobacteraceae bacterium]|jgi:threonine/homoserine/homoserine lactone efflux protein|nr:LysE family translocator [Paracoccaceae bacterium]